MDTTVEQILVGLLTNALSSVIEKSWTSADDEEVLSADEAVKEAVRELVSVERISESVGGEELRAFLTTPGAASCIRMLFVARVHGSNSTTDDLRCAFVDAFRHEVPGVDIAQAERVFHALVATTEQSLEHAASAGDVAAAATLESARFRRLSEELTGLKLALDALRETNEPTAAQYLQWEALYRNQVLTRLGTITPPTFDATQRVPIENIYVEPSFGLPPALRHVSSRRLAETLNRTVVLGDPGAGKSTFAQKLAFDLARDQVRLPGGALTPLVVTLKDYGAEKQRSQISLLQWIEAVVNSDYNAPAPTGAVSYLLDAGRAIVIFDGLDELLDTSYRRQVTADIETFAARYVASPVLVTSRRIGYEQAPLDTRRFEIAYLNELDNDQIAQYARLWFGLRAELTPNEQVRMATDFVRDSEGAASDLRRNALMLALLCNIYRGGGYIPRSRPQVYEKCAVMLFERWDRGRRIVVPLEFERHLRPAMQHLAYWIYSSPDLRGGVSERRLVRTATEFLHERRFDDEDHARQEAQRFVEFCRGRAWVFTDTGTKPDGERLYQFTHRTFLEFFAAEHLVRTHRTPEELVSVLSPRIRDGEWDVVAQLAFQLQDDNIDGAADELIAAVLSDSDGAPTDTVLSFAARSLSFLVPRRRTCRNVADAVARRACEWLAAGAERTAESSSSPAESYRAIINSDRENFEPVAAALVERAMAYYDEDPSKVRAEAVLEVVAHADLATWGDEGSAGAGERWAATAVSAFEGLWPRIKNHLASSHGLAYDAYWFDVVRLGVLTEMYPAEFFFDSREFRIHRNFIRFDISQALLNGQLGRAWRTNGRDLGTRAELAELGTFLATAPPPWDTRETLHTGTPNKFSRDGLRTRDAHLDGPALFGGFAVLATAIERAERADEGAAARAGMSRVAGWIEMLRPWILKRFDADAEVQALPDLPLPEQMRHLVATWSRGEWAATPLAAEVGGAVHEVAE
jgi:hypothetical protein